MGILSMFQEFMFAGFDVLEGLFPRFNVSLVPCFQGSMFLGLDVPEDKLLSIIAVNKLLSRIASSLIRSNKPCSHRQQLNHKKWEHYTLRTMDARNIWKTPTLE